MLLVGDIGGTKARLALVSPEWPAAPPVLEATLPSQRYPGLAEVAAEFLRDARTRVDRAVFAVAGPVVGGRAVLTNLRWELDEARLRDALGVASVHLLNDLLAMAYAVPHLPQDALHTLQAGEPDRRGAIAVVAPGTGLGEAFLTWGGGEHRAHPSEGGHADFAPADALQAELLAWLRTRYEHVSVERVCSGRGLPNLYDFLAVRGEVGGAPWAAARLAAAEDRTPVILEAALAEPEPCPLCHAAVELFAAILAAEAGNMALRVLATGGVYLGGGMPRRILGLLTQARFLERFRRKGRLSPFLERLPLHVLTRQGVALRGAMRYAARLAAVSI